MYLTVKSQERKRLSASEIGAKYAISLFLLCACRNIWQVKDGMKEKITGINQREIVPATFAIAASWPKASKIGVVNKNKGSRKSEVMNKTIHDL